MGIGNWFRAKIDNWKEKQQFNKIKKRAYDEEMNKYAPSLGREKARLDAKHKVEAYKNKLKQARRRMHESGNKPIGKQDYKDSDPFGLKSFDSGKKFDVVNGSYLG